jgi:hypothetical protein
MITNEGWKLIERSVLYALERIPPAINPGNDLAVTWST